MTGVQTCALPICTSLGMARDFISSCAYWSRAFNELAIKIDTYLYKDESEDILTLRITFSSGKRVSALSSKPSSIRGLQGNLILDEFAFLHNANEFLKSATPMLIWGCKIFLISTHNGINSEFNNLIEQIHKGKLKYYLQKTTFKDAIIQGFYKRVCLSLGEPWNIDKQKAWVKDIYEQHGSNASEELDCIPKVSSNSAIFKSEWFKKISRDDLPSSYDYIAYGWDFAATENGCFTVGTLIGKKRDNFYILQWDYCQKDAKSTQNFVVNRIQSLPKSIPVYVELEGGSQAILWAENSFKPLLPGYRIKFVKVEGAKSIRSLPYAESAEKGNVYIVNESWADEYLKIISQFDGTPGVPLITDTGDSGSLTFNQVDKGVRGLIGT